jgi:opacity protein-like surface antigen
MNANEPYNNHDTHVSQETGLLFNLGFQYLRKVFPYFGVGLMWLPKVEDIYYDNDSGDANKKKSMLGGMVQLGVLYTLSPHWFLDVVYSCGITGSKLFNMANVDGDPINSKVRVFSQDVMIGINLQFSS